MDALQTQSNEFNAVHRLVQAYRNLPQVVDDDYPEMRHYYESAITELITAIAANGRLAPNARGIPALGLYDKVELSIETPQQFLILRGANQLRQKEWGPLSRITLAYRGNELGGECGEAQNEIKKLERERLGIKGSRTTKEALGKELADVIICVDLIAAGEGIDLWQAVKDKFNETSEKVGLSVKIT